MKRSLVIALEIAAVGLVVLGFAWVVARAVVSASLYGL